MRESLMNCSTNMFRWAAMLIGFKTFWDFWMLCSLVFWFGFVFAAMLMGFLMCLYSLFVFAAMLIGFLIFLCLMDMEMDIEILYPFLNGFCNIHSWMAFGRSWYRGEGCIIINHSHWGNYFRKPHPSHPSRPPPTPLISSPLLSSLKSCLYEPRHACHLFLH